MISFKFNRQKAIESVLWLIQRGETNMYNILKMLFAAEKYHLNKYGRPITGDDYYAMKHGTVATEIYTIIKRNRANLDFEKDENNILLKKRAPDTDYFSDTDIEALEHGYNEYAGLDFGTVEHKNHQEPSWEKCYVEGTSTRIPFEDIIEEEWLKEDLEGTSCFISL